VDAHGLPAKVTGAALAAAARSMKSGMAMIGSDMR
jgi:hypothetical protein